MTASERRSLRLHEDPDFFHAAVIFTATQTRFAPRLIEKDYFSSVLLHYLASAAPNLLFRGGTCLSKVHAGFYRLSEDLDFLISMPVTASRTERSRGARPLKKVVAEIPANLPGLRIITSLTGANESTQYNAAIAYNSMLLREEQTINLEMGLREPALLSPLRAESQTLLRNPITNRPMVPSFQVPCISLHEAMAEKLRAALTRREAAIRDFYDIDYAVRRLGLEVQAPAMVELVRIKLVVPGNAPVDVSPSRLQALRPQLQSELKPVLRDRDFAEFDLDRAFRLLQGLARVLAALA